MLFLFWLFISDIWINQGVKRLSDGLPNLVAVGSSSPLSCPSDNEHDVCMGQVEEFYEIPDLFNKLWNAVNYAWVGADQTGHYYYGSENDVATFVKNLLESFKSPLGIDVRICSEMGIKGTKPDILILTMNALLIGVVEIKKPGKNMLENGNVLGDLFDQMKLLQLLYSMGPAIGILTTGEQFLLLVAWLPQDSNVFSSAPMSAIGTPVHTSGDSSSSSTDGTPSQKNKSSFEIIDDVQDCGYEDIAVYTEERLLCCTPTFTANHNVSKLMSVLSTALIRMTHSQPNYCKKLIVGICSDFTRGWRRRQHGMHRLTSPSD